jgi:hypothetical protein
LEITDVYPEKFWDPHTGTIQPYDYHAFIEGSRVLVWLHILGRRCTLAIRPRSIYTARNPACSCISWIDEAPQIKQELSNSIPCSDRPSASQGSYVNLLQRTSADVSCQLLESDREDTYIIRVYPLEDTTMYRLEDFPATVLEVATIYPEGDPSATILEDATM